jgi:hypothetical protein
MERAGLGGMRPAYGFVILATSAAIEEELRSEVGPDAVAALRRSLLALVTREGSLEDVLARRARPVL